MKTPHCLVNPLTRSHCSAAAPATAFSIKPLASGSKHLLLALCLAGWTLAVAAQNTAPTPAPVASSAVQPSPVNSDLSAQLFYQLLLGELNVQGGDPGAGFSLLLDAARKQRDPQLYRRAVEVALQARSGEAALTAARAWSQALPESPEADRFLLQILLALNRVEETGPLLKSLLARASGKERTDTINAIPQTFARVPDKALAQQVVREALAPQLQLPEYAAAAWTTVGRMALAQEQWAPALSAARRAHESDPGAPLPALLALELMERGQTEAEVLVRQHLQARTKTDADRITVPLTYARILLDLQRTAEARTQLQELTQSHPESAEPWLLLATLQIQENQLPAAGASLQKYMTLARASSDERLARGLTQAYLLMAQIAERQKDFSAANAWLDRIENAEDIMAAQVRRASLLAKQGQLPQARALLRSQPERRPEDARLKYVVEAQLLRDNRAYQQAYEVYGEAVARFPEDTELVYDQAMMAEKADRLDAMEKLLRQLIAAKPDHHHAYNALGYSFAERGVRLPEARQLIEKAVELAPGDAYIQDSLAWLEYRQGNLAKALDILRAAYAKRPDVEIAAHLGEVLWVQGQREQALKIWREALLLSNDNATLQETLKRLQAKP
ncbi:tetratricopeptide repeat protein [Hydrogenophaga sp.]|uniref:tetratricopeptide repeat protein n=1 Tax=Hydrogenophaga sp. TaxID=1904254 RepID=UPI00356902D8